VSVGKGAGVAFYVAALGGGAAGGSERGDVR